MAKDIIRNNAGAGIVVTRQSSAWIVGNSITGNGSHGAVVDRPSQSDDVGNTIDANQGDAHRATHNSGINLESEGKESVQVGTNSTAAASSNTGVGSAATLAGT